ncbi:hypothetical protein ABPG75_005237 [Micractinium tetrahymenae]
MGAARGKRGLATVLALRLQALQSPSGVDCSIGDAPALFAVGAHLLEQQAGQLCGAPTPEAEAAVQELGAVVADSPRTMLAAMEAAKSDPSTDPTFADTYALAAASAAIKPNLTDALTALSFACGQVVLAAAPSPELLAAAPSTPFLSPLPLPPGPLYPVAEPSSPSPSPPSSEAGDFIQDLITVVVPGALPHCEMAVLQGPDVAGAFSTCSSELPSDIDTAGRLPPGFACPPGCSRVAQLLGTSCIADIQAAAQQLAASSPDPTDAASAQVLAPLFQACSSGA